MGRMVVKTTLPAPLERCFDLARDVGVHCRTAVFTSERAVAPGRTSGLLELGDTVTFEGRHFGVRLRLTARIVEMERPRLFVDEAVTSAFESLRHVHGFATRDGATEMTDTVEWTAPFEPIGTVADVLFMVRHMTSFVRTNSFPAMGISGIAAEVLVLMAHRSMSAARATSDGDAPRREQPALRQDVDHVEHVR